MRKNGKEKEENDKWGKIEKVNEENEKCKEKNVFGVYQNGNFYREKAKNMPGKNRENWHNPPEKFPCYAPASPTETLKRVFTDLVVALK